MEFVDQTNEANERVDEQKQNLAQASERDERPERPAYGGFKKVRNQDVGPGPLACPLARSLAPHCWLRSRAPLCSFICSLARSLTRSRARGAVKYFCQIFKEF